MADYRMPGGSIPKAAGIEPGPRSAGAGGRSPKPMQGKPASMSFREKSGFPGADLPGKSGPDRSAGVHKCKVYPTSKGL